MLVVKCNACVGGKMNNDDDNGPMDGEKIIKAWNTSRTIVYIYLVVFGLLISVYYLLQHAVRYLNTTDANCAAPGTLVTELWSWDFILQGLYSPFLWAYFILGFSMLVFWYERIPYVIFGVYCLLITAFFLGAAVYLSIQAGKANTCAAVGNPFNDVRICGVCGTFTAWITHCYNQAPYNPPVQGPLSLNWPKAFQLGYTWVIFAFMLAALFYVPTQYRKVQEAYKELLSNASSPPAAPTSLKVQYDQPLLQHQYQKSSRMKRNILK